MALCSGHFRKVETLYFTQHDPRDHGIGTCSALVQYGGERKAAFPERKFLYFCIGCGVLLISFSHIIPFKILRRFDQTGFIRNAVLPHYSTGARVFADDGMAPAAAWVLRRNVELCFDGAQRDRKALSSEQLKKIIMKADKKRQQIIIFTRNRDFLSEFPSRRTMIRSGRMTAVIYGEQSE